MALTVQEKQDIMEALTRTGGNREMMMHQRIIPEEYMSYMKKVDRQEIQLSFPEVDVPVRCVISTAQEKKVPCPVHINLHGGGFVLPQNEDDDRYCARIADGIGGIVIDVDYATSDRYPFPVAFDQSYEVVKWAFGMCAEWNADPERVSVGGHSAGGCLAAAISIKAAVTGDFRLCVQILDYAANDLYMSVLPDGQERSRAFSLLYADGDTEKLKEPYVSPVFAPVELLKSQPRTVIIEAGQCPFREVNRKFGMNLVSAGNEVIYYGFPESPHGFTVRIAGQWEQAQKHILYELNRA